MPLLSMVRQGSQPFEHSGRSKQVDAVADAAMTAGASGLKISGAGGGGFMMIAVNPQQRHQVIRALEPLGGRFFSFGFVSEGVESWTCK